MKKLKELRNFNGILIGKELTLFDVEDENGFDDEFEEKIKIPNHVREEEIRIFMIRKYNVVLNELLVP